MEGAALLATTTGATRFYRARENGPPQRAESVLTLGRDSSLEWLPQETIVFSGARGVAESRIEMEEGAKLIFAEITVLGRPGAMEEFARGRFDSFLSVRAHGRLALRERTGAVGSLEETGGPRWAQSPVGLGGYPTSAFFLAGGGGAREREKLERLAGALQRARGKGARLFPEAWGVTARDGFLLLRAVGADAGAARALLYLAWKLARPALLGRAARPPRIWRT
jgi:urease accessory protein